MILAGIDIGTNTLRLLIAEIGNGSFHEILSDRKIIRLGQSLDRTGRLSFAAVKRSLVTLADFAKSVRSHAAIHVAAVGTSALRNASNSAEYITIVKERTGLAVTVVSGEEEARLTLLGVTHVLQDYAPWKRIQPASALVIDIGGGSTEIIMKYPGHETTTASLPLGVVYLTERIIKHDPPLEEVIELLRCTIHEELEKHGDVLVTDFPWNLVGTAGTITTLAAMDQNLSEYDPGKINGYAMTKDTVDGIVARLIKSTIEERKDMAGLEKGREDIILSGAVITQEVMNHFGFSTMIVSDWGLREGIVLDLYEKVQKTSCGRSTHN